MDFREGKDASSRWWPFNGTPRSWGKATEAADGLEALDALSLAEKGLARECPEDCVRALPASSRLRRFYVTRSSDRLQYRLHRDEGDFEMYARVMPDVREVHFFLYDPGDKENSLYNPERPALTMDFDPSKTEWMLSYLRGGAWSTPTSPAQVAQRRRRGVEKEELAFLQHSKRKVGDGDNYCLEAVVPSGLAASARVDKAISGASECGVERLLTRKAVWNEEMQTLVLDFKDRNVLPSAKNFQLFSETHPGKVVCQHGKMSQQTFALDFRAPLSTAQAFAMAVSTVYWQ